MKRKIAPLYSYRGAIFGLINIVKNIKGVGTINVIRLLKLLPIVRIWLVLLYLALWTAKSRVLFVRAFLTKQILHLLLT